MSTTSPSPRPRRERWLPRLALVACLALTLSAARSEEPPEAAPGAAPVAPAPPAPAVVPGPQDAPEASSPVPTDLDEMLALALDANPDVLLAEAKVGQAEAELHQARLKVAQAVMEVRAERERLQDLVAAVEKAREEAKQLFDSGMVSSTDFDRVRAEAMRARADLARVEATVRYLCGVGPSVRGRVVDAAGKPVEGAVVHRGPPEPPSEEAVRAARDSINLALVALARATMTSRRVVPPGVNAAAPKTAVERALEAPFVYDVRGKPLPTVLDFVRERTGITIVVDPSILASAERLNVAIGPATDPGLPLSTWLQALGDALDLVFVPREYGVLLTTPARAATLLR